MTSKMMLLPVVHCENCRRGNDEELGLDLYDTERVQPFWIYILFCQAMQSCGPMYIVPVVLSISVSR